MTIFLVESITLGECLILLVQLFSILCRKMLDKVSNACRVLISFKFSGVFCFLKFCNAVVNLFAGIMLVQFVEALVIYTNANEKTLYHKFFLLWFWVRIPCNIYDVLALVQYTMLEHHVVQTIF